MNVMDTIVVTRSARTGGYEVTYKRDARFTTVTECGNDPEAAAALAIQAQMKTGKKRIIAPREVREFLDRD